MRTSAIFIFHFLLFTSLPAQASWYWPFDKDEDEPDRPRLSELMEPASTNIDAAVEFAADGKYKEAQDCYRAALAALNAIEADTNNADRVGTPEFATVRNKRAYVNAALDSMLLAEARENAKAVAVTDTTALEVKLALKPWQEFQPTYVALTNADRLVCKRLAFVESPWARELLDAATDPRMKQACAPYRRDYGPAAAFYADQRDDLTKAYREAAAAVARLEKFSDAASSSGGARVFDVCRKDVRTNVAACQKAWSKVSEALDKLVRNLAGLYGVILEVGAKRDFSEIANAYAEKAKKDHEAAEAMAKNFGYLRACETMLEELDAAKAGFVYRGTLYKLRAAWGGEEMDVPTKEEDNGLVKDGGDKRPEIKSQLDTYMVEERKRHERVTKAAEKVKAQKGVRKEVKKLLKEDPKSRRARMLIVGEDLRSGDTAAAAAKVKVLLDEKPNDGPALNMRAAIEAAEGDLKAAEKTLDQAIQSTPRDYHAYYNMANVYLEKGNVDGARRYYETGRSFAGPKDAVLEKAVMYK